MLKKMIPYIQGGQDFDRAILFYTETLGFQQTWRSMDMAIMQRDQVEIFLQNFADLHAAQQTQFRVEVSDVDAYYAEVKASGILDYTVDVTQPGITPLSDTLWDTREFSVRDWAGVCIQFYESISAEE